MADTKNHLFQEVAEARVALWDAVNALDAAAEICPGWNKRDFFAHIAGWEAMVFEAIRDCLAGMPLKPYPYKNAVDTANADFVAQRQFFTLEMARLECEINRFAILTLLETIPAEDFDQPIQFPWGQDSPTQFMHDAIKHERDHMNDILRLKQENHS